MMEQFTIKEISKTIKTGKTPPTKEDKYFNGELDWYTPGDLKLNKFLKRSQRTLTNLAITDKKATIHEPGTLLIGCIGDIGKLGITTTRSSSNQQLTGIYPNENTDVNYLYYWFRGHKKVLENYSNNAVVPILNNRTLETIKIPLPPLPTQKKIAAILDAADAYRQKTKALIEKYDELTQSLFLDMFGEKGKYKQETIENLVEKITDGTHHTPKYTESGVPFLRVTDVTKSNKTKKFISKEEHKQLIKRCKPENGDVLYTKNGTIGIAKLVDWDYEFSIFVSLCLLKPKHKIINNKFLESFLNTPFALKQALRHSKTGTITNLHLVEIKKIKIPLPNMEIQIEFVEKVQKIEAQKAQAQESLKKAEELFNSLLGRAFKGEV